MTAYDPAGANGFPGSNTTCVSASGTPTPGSGGCPSGAAILNTSSFNTALGSSHLANAKRVLFKCGDTFTGDNLNISATKWSIGAYGGCEGTQTNRPIMSDSGSGGEFQMSGSPAVPGDGRISDLNFEGNGRGAYALEQTNGGIAYQITLYNLYSNGNNANFAWSQGAQWGLIGSVATEMLGSHIGTYPNFGENNPPYNGNVVNNLDYQALLGNLLNGAGGTASSSGQETVRISACRMCVIENNTIENANNVGAVLKIHNGNTYLSSPTWSGAYTELLEISDNWFGGASGANLVETAPQNSSYDERLRNIVVERNLFAAGNANGRQILVSAVNETLRDNVFYTASGDSTPPEYGIQIARRGVEPVPTGVEAYNNTCYALSSMSGQACVGFDSTAVGTSPGVNSYAKNNLLYLSAGGHSTVVNNGTGNTVSNNTATPTNNPSITNGSGTFSLLSDFKPTANYSGGTSVPVWYDALDVLWSSTWDLGAVHP